jgi:hypothetical protein
MTIEEDGKNVEQKVWCCLPIAVTEAWKTEAIRGGDVMALSISEAAAVLGRRGGAVKSTAKATAARKNGKLGGRPKVTNAQIDKFADKILAAWREISK